MSEYSRLSELIGITADDRDGFQPETRGSVWALNALLVLLGSAILAVAFYFLDPQEPRLLFNPWTYAIATPIALIVFSTLLSNLVSRMVEKSMQMAFLLSVLIHLLLLVYAVNIVIFSRMWPDVLDSLAVQRQQLKREALQAKQYHNVSPSKQAGRRPEHLSYVPTEHQPTELEQAISPAIQLARTERIDLPTPRPELVPTASPHLLERKQPTLSQPAVSEHAASLSRSSLSDSQPLLNASTPAVSDLAAESPSSLEASTAAAKRRRPQSASLTPTPTPSTLEPAATQVAMERLQAEPEMTSTTAQALDLPARREAAALPPRGSAVESLASLEPMATETALAPSEIAAASDRRVYIAPALSRLAPSLSSLQPTPSRSSRLNVNRSERAEEELQLPAPSTGAAPATIARNTAGGSSGPTAPSSLRVQGPEALATDAATQGELSASPSSRARRGNTPQSKSASLADMGNPASPTWSAQPSLSGGVAGTSPSQLANSAASGNAAASDIASLMGSGKVIDRSAIGLSGQPGALALPAAGAQVANSDRAGSGDTTTGDAIDGGVVTGEAPGLESGSAALQRSSQRGSRGQGLGSTAAVDQLAPSGVGESAARMAGLPNGMERAVGDSRLTEAAAVPNSGSKGVPRANPSLGSSPAEASVELPEAIAAALRDTTGDASGEAIGESLSADVSGSRARSDAVGGGPSASTPLEIEALAGLGGLSPVPDVEGPLLPKRRDVESRELTPAQIESQRFSRQDVGGPLAAGRDVALPAPAFQQRLERLQDREAQDEAAVEPQTEQAIERGLAFLARNQRADGSWRLQDYDTPVLIRSDTAATGLALLAFQGAGYTHKQAKYADTCNRALKFLAKHQTAQGDLYIPQDPASDQNGWLYSHGIAALAVCEAYGMTQDPELRPLAQGAIDFMVKSQDKTYGGWRYRPGSGTDTSVTGWFMMAFKSGQLAGLRVPEEAFKRIEGYLVESQVSAAQPHLYRYNPFAADTPQQRHGLRPTAVMTSVGLLMRLYFGWQRERPEMMAGADYLLEHEPRHGTRSMSLRDTYYWYYATQVIFHMGGERWERWHDQLYPLLINSQVLHGQNEGSWDPLLPTPDLWARYGGRLYVTTMNLLSLEVSYRHLPLYEATAPSEVTE